MFYVITCGNRAEEQERKGRERGSMEELFTVIGLETQARDDDDISPHKHAPRIGIGKRPHGLDTLSSVRWKDGRRDGEERAG